MDQWWSWILTAVGLTGFILAGRKVWWSWYVNIACQALWYAYAIVTEQWGFLVAATAYTFVFSQNAYKWTKEHFDKNEGWDFNEYTHLQESLRDEYAGSCDLINGRLVEPYSFALNSWELMTMNQDELETYVEIEVGLWMERENMMDRSQVVVYKEPLFTQLGAYKFTFGVTGGKYREQA